MERNRIAINIDLNFALKNIIEEEKYHWIESIQQTQYACISTCFNIPMKKKIHIAMEINKSK